MAYWNPFGWSEDTRRSIQSIVRPVMQVASIAGSMGAFKGGGGTGGTTGEADFDAAPTLPEGVAPDTPGILEWNTDMDIDDPAIFRGDDVASGSLAMPDGSPLAPSQQYQTSPTMSVPAAGFTPSTGMDQALGASTPVQEQIADGFGLVDPSLMEGPISPEYQEFIDQSQQQQMLDGSLQATGGPVQLDVVPHQRQPIGGEAPSGDPNSPQTGVKLKTTQQPGEPPATKTPNKPEVKPEGEDGPGPGGKPKSIWEGGFNWKNIQEFLASDEGKKWMLSDEGLFGIGQKLTAAADAGVSGANLLTPEERKKIYARLKKERAERKKKEKEEDE